MNLGQTGTMAPAFQTYRVTNEDKIDLLAVGYYQDGIPLIVGSYLLPWNNVQYIDLDKDYWNKSATQTLTMLGYSYYLSGSINWNYMGTTMAYYFNKQLASDYQKIVGNLYDTVKQDKWTWDLMHGMAKELTVEKDDGVMGITDQWGLIQYKWTMNTHLYGAAYHTVYLNEKDGVVLNINTPKLIGIVQDVYDLFYTEKYGYFSTNTDELDTIFFDNRALFYISTLEYSAPFRTYDNDFGILPPPKYDEAQKSYHSYSDQWGLAMALPVTASDTARTGAITEALCSLSHHTIVPAYYERTLLGKIKRDDESEEMLDIIFKNVFYDIGITFSTNPETMGPLNACIYNGSSNLTSWFRKNEGPLKTNYQQLLDYLTAKKNEATA